MIEKNVKMIHTIFGSMAKIEIYLEKNESEFCGVFFWFSKLSLKMMLFSASIHRQST